LTPDSFESVGRGHVAAAPGAGERDAVLGCDEGGVRPGQGFGPNVVLPHPAQPRSAQRRIVAPDQWFEPGVAGFGQQYGADAGGDVASPRATLAGMGKPAGKADAGVHLKQHLGQVHPRQAGGNGCFTKLKLGTGSVDNRNLNYTISG